MKAMMRFWITPALLPMMLLSLNKNIENIVVKIRNNIYPYRVLQFYFEEDDAYGYFNERYAFVETKGRSWVLLRIAKEYDIAYAQRSKYIHGLSGSNGGFIRR